MSGLLSEPGARGTGQPTGKFNRNRQIVANTGTGAIATGTGAAKSGVQNSAEVVLDGSIMAVAIEVRSRKSLSLTSRNARCCLSPTRPACDG